MKKQLSKAGYFSKIAEFSVPPKKARSAQEQKVRRFI
jgi:hypothetical protein